MQIRKLFICIGSLSLGAATPAVSYGAPEVQTGDEQLIWVDGSAGRLRVSDGGNGAVPIVFVHALAGNRSQWQDQLAHARQTRRAVAFDFRGHGESDKPIGADYSLQGTAEDIAAVVDKLGLERFVLVGHSFGGGAAAVYAGQHPDRVAALLFVDPIGDQRGVGAQIEMLVMLLDSPSFQSTARLYYEGILANALPTVREAVMASLLETSQEAIVGAFRSLTEFDPITTLQPFDGPMLSVISDLNNFTTSLHNVVPNLPSQPITGTSHWLHMDRPEEFNQHLDRFLSTVR